MIPPSTYRALRLSDDLGDSVGRGRSDGVGVDVDPIAVAPGCCCDFSSHVSRRVGRAHGEDKVAMAQQRCDVVVVDQLRGGCPLPSLLRPASRSPTHLLASLDERGADGCSHLSRVQQSDPHAVVPLPPASWSFTLARLWPGYDYCRESLADAVLPSPSFMV